MTAGSLRGSRWDGVSRFRIVSFGIVVPLHRRRIDSHRVSPTSLGSAPRCRPTLTANPEADRRCVAELAGNTGGRHGLRSGRRCAAGLALARTPDDKLGPYEIIAPVRRGGTGAIRPREPGKATTSVLPIQTTATARS